MTDRAGFSLYVYGRLHGLTRGRLQALVIAAGGQLETRPNARVDLVALGHGSAGKALADGPPIALPRGISQGVRLISECALKRLLGLLPPQASENRTFSAEGLAGACRVDVELVRTLAAYDVLEPDCEAFGFRDMRALRETARLLQTGLALHQVIDAATTLRRSGRSLSDTQLCEAPWGDIVQHVGGKFGLLNGQLALALDELGESADGLFERAEECEASGDLAGAERWYRVAARIDRTDPVHSFNLGNVLDALGREKEAAFAYQEALATDPAFADAWVNLGLLRARSGQVESAKACYSRALAARPDSSEALFNLALLLTEADAYRDAIPHWERYLATRPEDGARARRLLALCRIGSQPQHETALTA